MEVVAKLRLRRTFATTSEYNPRPMEEFLDVNWEQRYLALGQRFHALEQRCAELLAENQALLEQQGPAPRRR